MVKFLMVILFLLSDGSHVGPFDGSIGFDDEDECKAAIRTPDTRAGVRDAVGYLNQMLAVHKADHPEDKDLTIVDVQLDCVKLQSASN